MEVEAVVRERAAGLCEYCHANERWQYVRFMLDHVRPRVLGGDDTPNNLALACFHCNRRKSDRDTATDPASGVSAPLFDPRRDAWVDHFRWAADRIWLMGVTSTGRATVEALQMNRERALQVREADLAIGRHPPANDPVEARVLR
jgi:HNH endonuclease